MAKSQQIAGVAPNSTLELALDRALQRHRNPAHGRSGGRRLLAVVRNGYRCGERILRPAEVIIASRGRRADGAPPDG